MAKYKGEVTHQNRYGKQYCTLCGTECTQRNPCGCCE